MNDEAASAVFGFFTRLSEDTTFAEVKLVPSVNFTFFRSWKVMVFPPFENDQLVARSGVTWSLSL